MKFRNLNNACVMVEGCDKGLLDVRNANVDDSNKAKVFKDSIRRAVYKASPLPLAAAEAAFDKELIFGVN